MGKFAWAVVIVLAVVVGCLSPSPSRNPNRDVSIIGDPADTNRFTVGPLYMLVPVEVDGQEPGASCACCGGRVDVGTVAIGVCPDCELVYCARDVDALTNTLQLKGE